MTEIFEGRCDHLYRRHVTFEQQPEEGGGQEEKKKEEEQEEGDDNGRTEMKIPQVAAAERGFLNDGGQKGVLGCGWGGGRVNKSQFWAGKLFLVAKPHRILKSDRGAVEGADRCNVLVTYLIGSKNIS